MGSTTMRESRLVVLPAFQGFGIGPRLSSLVGDRLLAAGFRFFSRTHHPRLGRFRDINERWRPSWDNHKVDRSRGMASGALAKKKAKRGNSPSGGSDACKQQAHVFAHQYIGDTIDGNDALTEKDRNPESSGSEYETSEDEKKKAPAKKSVPKKRKAVVRNMARPKPTRTLQAAMTVRIPGPVEGAQSGTGGLAGASSQERRRLRETRWAAGLRLQMRLRRRASRLPRQSSDSSSLSLPQGC